MEELNVSNTNKSFGQLRREWLPNGESDNINYCIPINLGVVAQDTSFQSNDVDAAVLVAMQKLSRHFNRHPPSASRYPTESFW